MGVSFVEGTFFCLALNGNQKETSHFGVPLSTPREIKKAASYSDPCGGRHERFLTGDPHFWATGCRARALFDLVNAQVLEVPVEFLGTSAQGFEVSG